MFVREIGVPENGQSDGRARLSRGFPERHSQQKDEGGKPDAAGYGCYAAALVRFRPAY
jgi:hypothetical protein